MPEALDTVIRKVAEDAMRECLSILESAERDAMSILEGEMREASGEAEEIIESARRQAGLERSRILSMAEVSSRNEALKLIEDYVSMAIDRAVEKLRRATSMPEYRDTMRRLLLEGLEAIGGDAKAWTNADGIGLLKELAEEVSRSTGFMVHVVEEPIDCIAGLKLSSLDGKRVFDNTVEGRLRRLRPVLRREVAKILTAE
ncbi:MAG: hypothetical protein B9J98_06910 [Candidatus Terraquivivens tikiterensis]|uniref:A-type ATP synthase subunit E n=2 Tax=Candidatus Terraquivivens tikiterensis TaxID=1980982 RepID=A0A2R7Y193_9ARCH|nr:MAG: hypothetical protein B9J98_06910 [Candidatus Terraquivivens tikiterensis]